MRQCVTLGYVCRRGQWLVLLAGTLITSGYFAVVVDGSTPESIGIVQDAPPPAFSPGTGTYANAVTVTLSTSEPGAVIKYTTDGTDPNVGSTTYASPLNITSTTVVKAKLFVITLPGHVPISTTSTATYTLVADTPTFTPPAGTYTSTQSVTVASVTSGATIRYTTNGNDPTETDTTIASGGSVTVDHTLTLKAKAWKTGFTPSAVQSASYVINTGDTTPPTVTTNVFSSPNAAGWNNGDVTVRFTCADDTEIAFCPAPVTVTQETAGVVVTGTAIDTSDNETPASVTVRIDRTPPTVVLDDPSEHVTTTDTSFTVEAQASDALSGLAQALCDGVETPVVNGEVTCVAPLRPGTNSVVVQVLDQAGNSASHGLTVMRNVTTVTSLNVAPAKLAILLGDTRVFELIDDAGAPVVADTWTSADTSVATIAVVDGEPELTAVGGGTTTITAQYQTLTATADVTVVSGFVLPVGTIQWSIAPLLGGTISDIVAASPADSTFYDYFIHDNTWNVIRAVDDIGGEAARFPVAPDSGISFAHAKGGVVVREGPSLVRIAAPFGERPWRFYLGEDSYDVLQSPNGTIYASKPDQVMVINGDTGQLLTREYLPQGWWRQLNIDCDLWRDYEGPVQEAGRPVIDSRGRFRLPFVTLTGFADHCFGNWQVDNTIRLLTIDGTSVSYTDVNASTSEFLYEPRMTVADDDGGVAVAWKRSGPVEPEEKGAHVGGDGGVSLYGTDPEEDDGLHGLVDLATHRRFTWDGSELAATDTTTGATVWTSSLAGEPVAVLEDGVLAVSSGGTLYHVDEAGIATAAGPVPATMTSPMLGMDGAWVGLNGGLMISVAGDGDEEGSWFSNQVYWVAGNWKRQGAPTIACTSQGIPIPFSPSWRSLIPGATYTYRFLPPAQAVDNWTDKERKAVHKAFQLWNKANQKSGLNTSFTEWRPAQPSDPNYPNDPPLNVPIRKAQYTIQGGVSPPGVTTQDTVDPVTGYITGALITFQLTPGPTTKPTKPKAFRKIALHEIGHMLGLGDVAPRPIPGKEFVPGASVMNGLGGDANDSVGYLPTNVQSCDRKAAFLAPNR
jgi:hypothetical protein